MPIAQALPSFEALHPLVVHFPIALLLVAWVILVGGLIDHKRRWGWLLGGLTLLVIGTAGMFLGVSTGEAAAGVAPDSQLIRDAIHAHEEDAETARTVFVVVTLLVGLTMLGTRLKPGKRAVVVSIGVIVSALSYMAGAAILAQAAHAGGLLVHDLGVHAPLAAAPDAAAPPEQTLDEDANDDDDTRDD